MTIAEVRELVGTLLASILITSGYQMVRSEGMTILVVEDDADVLRCLETVLRHYGSVVYSANSGKEAVQFYNNHPGDIDLVLMDVQMPEMDGPQTFALLKRINSAVRVVFMSGYAGIYSVAELLALGALRVVKKPLLNLAELAKTLRALAAEGRPEMD